MWPLWLGGGVNFDEFMLGERHEKNVLATRNLGIISAFA
jgi:hypothetical protein